MAVVGSNQTKRWDGRKPSAEPCVVVTPSPAASGAVGEAETISVRLGDDNEGVTFVGTRDDVHRMIIEADRQLGQFASRFPLV